jgi:predicted nucleic acid-binding protein
MILLDSSILIDFFRKKEKKNTLLFELTNQDKNLYISTITYYEVGVGNRKNHYEFWNELTEYLTVLPFDKVCSDSAIEIYQELIKKNELIDLADLFIGATAITHNIPLATLNKKHFKRIKGIELI